MTESRSHADRVAALLALEDRVGAEQYAAYRRRLDGRLRRAARRRPIRPRTLAAAAALLLALGGLASFLSDSRRRAGPPTVVLRELTRDDVIAADPHPYRNVARCQVVAVVRAGPPVQQQGERRVPLEVENVFRNETGKELPAFQCTGEVLPPAPTSEQRVLVYLTYSRQQGWGCADVVPVDSPSGRNIRRGVERCAELLRAPDSPDAKRLYERLLAEGRGGLDEAAGCALCCRPDSRSADVLLRQLRRLHKRIGEPREGPGGWVSEDDIEQLVRLAEVLAPLRESRAALPLAECARMLPRGRRAPIYRQLPEVCATAPVDLKAKVRRLVAKELTEHHPDGRDRAAAAAALPALSVPAR